jgi:hypothetical protein
MADLYREIVDLINGTLPEPQPDPALGTVILRGSYGDITVHRATGAILDYGHHDPSEPEYQDILFILPETLKPGRDSCLDEHGETDILNVGFVDDRGRVTDAMPWSAEEEGWFEPAGLLPAPQGSASA